MRASRADIIVQLPIATHLSGKVTPRAPQLLWPERIAILRARTESTFPRFRVRYGRDTVVMDSMTWELLAAAAAPCRTGGPPSWALCAYEAIMDRATEAGLDVGSVAAQTGVHPVHLARVFRATWGCSPGELLRWRRVDRAADMLRLSDISGAQIAARVGFADQSHMTRAFQAMYGVAPGVYRRRHVSRIQVPGSISG